MKRVLGAFLIGLLGVVVQTGWAQTTDPIEHIRKFSELKQIDASRLLNGDIVTIRGSLMNYPNGISAESCFAVLTPPEETAKRLQQWDPSKHDDLKVYEYHPLSDPCTAADFQSLSKGAHHSLRGLLDKTSALPKRRADFFLSNKEEGELIECVKNQRTEENVGSCWAKLLIERVQSFQHNGYKDVPPYQTGGEQIQPVVELRSLLLDQKNVSDEFAPILGTCGLLKHTGTGDLAPYHYWSYFDADHHDTLALGVAYRTAVADHFQIVDVEYYVSGSYYISVTFYEIWPITAGGKTGSLVWRDDMISAPMLAYTKGTERIAYGALMLQDIKKSIRFFQEDMKGKQ